MITLLLAIVASSAVSTHVIHPDRDKLLAVEIAVPVSWGYSDQAFSVSHHRYVLMCSNNQGEDTLRVLDWRERQSDGRRQEVYSPRAFELQLKPGTVYLDLAVWGGPGSEMASYAWTKEQGLQAQVQRARLNGQAQWETEGLVVYRFRFPRWGLPWEGLVAARKPFDMDDLNKAFAILDTLHFPDVPVVDPYQAVEVAVPFLPEALRPPTEYEWCEFWSHYRVETRKTGESYRVTFSVLHAIEAQGVVRSAICRVEHNGAVSVLELQDR